MYASLRPTSFYLHICTVVDLWISDLRSTMLRTCAWASVWLGFCLVVDCGKPRAHGRCGSKALVGTVPKLIWVKLETVVDGQGKVSCITSTQWRFLYHGFYIFYDGPLIQVVCYSAQFVSCFFTTGVLAGLCFCSQIFSMKTFVPWLS